MCRVSQPTATYPVRHPIDDIVDIAFGAPSGSIVAIAGANHHQVLAALDRADHRGDGRLALFVPLAPAATAEQIVEQIAEVLAETALRAWPVWFTNVDFGECADDTLGREAARALARRAASDTTAVQRPWAESAALTALAGRKPRVPGTAAAVEIAQLCLAINRAGLVLIVGTGPAQLAATALVHALEWVSRNAHVAVVALFEALPDNVPPFDRILHGAIRLDGSESKDILPPPGEEAPVDRPWLVAVNGFPHPLSATEQRLAKALTRDRELAPLFAFNQFIETVRGNRPKVDLVWATGRLIVELDGFSDHGTRRAFMHDRHRDYELTLSGYTVIRLANEEITQDIEKAIEKIRDIVQLCRARMR
jgi:very-short-patch-repair endonuclease